VAALEAATGLHLLCWLDPGAGPLLPVLSRRAQPRAQQLAAAQRLNGLAERAQVEPARRRVAG
jgi:hypothetical protein